MPPSTQDPDRIESAEGGLTGAIGRVISVLLKPELAKWRFRMFVALLLTVTAKGFSVAAPLYLGHAINLAGSEDKSSVLSALIWALVLFSGARFLSTAFPQVRDAIFAPVSQDAQRVLATTAYSWSQTLSLGFHQTRRAGALYRVIERGGGALDVMLRFLVFNISPTIIELVLASIVLAVAYDPALAGIACATIVTYMAFTFWVSEWRAKQRRILNAADTELRAQAMDSLNNFETVKAFAAEERESERYDEVFRKFNVTYVDNARSLTLLNSGQELIMNLGMLAMLIWTGVLVLRGTVEVGALAAVFAMLLNLYRPLNILGWGWREIRQGVVDLEKIFGLLSMKSDVADKEDARVFSPNVGDVKFESVSFSHDERAAGLSDISFNVPPGRSLAIVGPSGSGKSTLLKLLFRFFDASDGSVSIDGQNVKDLQQMSLRAHLGLVPQDVVLFNDTIRNNLLYGRPNASQSDLDYAAKQAQLLDFIESLPKGWETRVGERGLKLSGGEKQRVGLARVILSNPTILVLDEATSALDSQTEERVQQAIDEASKGRTTIMVAHRLSTVAKADEILVLQQGRIVERGDHETLLSRDGLYADMWRKQSAGGNSSVHTHMVNEAN